MEKAFNIGDDITLNCVTNWNPNITLHWFQKKIGVLRNAYIANAGPQNENGYIWQRFRDDSRFSFSYENVSSSEMKIALTLYISNITEGDSANYTCVSFQKGSFEPKYLYKYDVRAIDCTCSLESNVVCDIFGLHLSNLSSVSLRVDGRTVTGLFNDSRLEFSSRLLNESTYNHSIEVFSSDGILSNISCTLPIGSSQSSTHATTTFLPTKTSVLPSQPGQSPYTSSKDYTSHLPIKTQRSVWQPSTSTTEGSQMEDMYTTSEPSTTIPGITTDDSRSSSTITIALSICLSCVAGIAILLIAVLIKVRKEDSALPYRNRLQTIKDASPSPSDYEYEEVDDSLQGEDNTCCTVPNDEHEYTGLCRATLERDAGGYMALRVSDENASGNLAPSVTGEIREDYMLMRDVESNAEGYGVRNVTRDLDEKVYPVPNVTGLDG